LRLQRERRQAPEQWRERINLIALRYQDEIEKHAGALKYQALPARFRVGDGLDASKISC
jgi:hypothetical protein